MESKQCPVSLFIITYLTPNLDKFCYSYVQKNPASPTRVACKLDYHVNGDGLAPLCTLCKEATRVLWRLTGAKGILFNWTQSCSAGRKSVCGLKTLPEPTAQTN